MTDILKYGWKATGIFTVIVLILSGVLSYYSYDTLLSTEQMSAVTGPQEGYYWTVSQYQLVFERMDNQLVRYVTGVDKDIDNLNLRYQILQSKFHILSQPSQLTEYFRNIPEYSDDVSKLNVFMLDVEKGLLLLPNDRKIGFELLGRFDEIRGMVNELTNSVRSNEIRHRDEVIADFYHKRRQLYISGMLLWTIFVLWVGLLLLNGLRYRQLIQQKNASLRAEQKAAIAAQKAIFAKNTFLGMISHELRTPLQTIISSIDLLTLRQSSNRDDQVISRLSTAAEHLEAQMKDLTDYARLDSGKLELRLTTFNPGELIQNVIGDFIPLAEKKGLKFISEVKCSKLSVLSDAYRIQQIASNLITNAIKYTEQGYISVHLTLENNEVPQLVLAVADTGPGIPTVDLPMLFEPFMQSDQTSTRRYDGAGMGLAIVERLVKLLGGKIAVDSEVGRGSRFEVRFPVDTVAELDAGDDSATPNVGPRRILLVDDNSDLRLSLKEVLEELGYSCDVSESGRDAIGKVGLQRYDAILLDIQMPELDGFAVAAAIRENTGPNQHVPILGISAYSPQLDSQAQLFTSYLMKPIRQDKLRAMLADLIH